MAVRTPTGREAARAASWLIALTLNLAVPELRADEPTLQCTADSAVDRCVADGDVASAKSPEMPKVAFGNPASLLTGAKHQRETDIERVGLLGFERVYDSSLTDANVGLGQGWTHSYATRLWSVGAAGLEIRQGDGRRIRFEEASTSPDDAGPDDTRTWKARHPSDGWLAKRHDGSWRWRLPDGRTLRFHGGWLVNVSVPGEGSLALRYSRQRLASVTDDAGRTLRFEHTPGRVGLAFYDANPEAAQPGHLAAVVRPDGTRIVYTYDGRKNLVRATWPDGTSRQYHYEDDAWPSRLTGLTDRRGIRTNRWSYADDGGVRTAELADGDEALELDRRAPSATGLPGRSTIVSGAGARATWEWERDPVSGAARIVAASGDACRSCPPAGAGRRYAYDRHGLPAEEIDADGGARLTLRDELGRTVERRRRLADGTEVLERAFAHEGESHRIVRDSRPSVRPSNTFDVEYHRDARGLVDAVTERGFSPVVSDDAEVVDWVPIERRTRIERENGRVVAIDGPRDDVDDAWRFERDAGGELVAVYRPDGRDVVFEARNASGRVTRFRIDDEPPVSIEHDGDGRPVRIAQRGLALGIGYDAEGRITRHTDPWGRSIDLEHDGAGRLRSLVDDLGRRVAQRHDADGYLAGRDVFGTDGELIASVTLYRDLAGAIVSLEATHADADGIVTGRSIGFERDALGRLLSLGTAGGGALSVERDASGDVRSVTMPDGERHDIELDATRRVARHAGPTEPTGSAGNATRAWRDDFGRLVAEHHPAIGLVRYGHGTGAHWTTHRTADGVETRRRFDGADRLIESRDADGADRYEYDATTGHLVRAWNAASDERFAWSEAGDLTRHERTLGGRTYVTGYTHDAHGRLATRALPGGPTLHYHYHRDGPDVGRLRAITRSSWFGLREETLVGEIDLDARDGKTGHVAHNGLRTVRRFAANGEPLSIDIERAMRVRYTHDDAGRIVGIDRDGTLERYAYAGDRLVDATTALGRFRRDATGDDAVPASGERGLPANARTPGRDAAGRRLHDGADRTLVWNEAGRLASVVEDGRTIAEYAYDAFGERVGKTVHDGTGSRTTYYLYEGTTLAAEIAVETETGRAGSTGGLRHYVHLDDRPVALIEGATTHALHTDHLGTVRLATDDDARAGWSADYSPHGSTRVTLERVRQPLRLPGQYHDAETGLHYNLHRYYDPDAARYLSPDPVGLRGGFDRYAYAEGSPLTYADPLGLAPDPRVRARDAAIPIKPVADQDFTERLQTTFGMVVDYGDLPGEIGEAIMEQLTPGNLAATGAVIGLFAALQATPLGWFADIILVGAAWYEFGSIAVDLVMGLVDLATSLAGATTRTELCAAADRLSGLLAQVVAEFAGDVALFGAAGAVKGSKLIRELFSSNRDEALAALPRPCRRAKVGDGCGLDANATISERLERETLDRLAEDHARLREPAERVEGDGKPVVILPGPAVARAFAVLEDGTVLETSREFTNLPQDMRNGKERAIKKLPPDGKVFEIPDIDEYMKRVIDGYAETEIRLHHRTAELIRRHVESGGPFLTQDGLPGLHAEIQAVNELFHLDGDLRASDITVATLKLFRETPDAFPACANCSSILGDFNVVTGRINE